MTRRRSTPILAGALGLALVGSLVLGACGGGDDDDSGSTSTTEAAEKPVRGDAVTIEGFAFGPEALAVDVGTAVTWTNEDSATHTATADDGTFDTKSLKSGTSGEFTFEETGTVEYHCDIHSTMTGSVVVG